MERMTIVINGVVTRELECIFDVESAEKMVDETIKSLDLEDLRNVYCEVSEIYEVASSIYMEINVHGTVSIIIEDDYDDDYFDYRKPLSEIVEEFDFGELEDIEYWIDDEDEFF